MPAYEYYCDLSESDQKRLDDMIRYFCDRPYGVILPALMYRIEDQENKIYAFKPRVERFFNFTADGAVVVITNAYRKHSQKMSKKDLEHVRLAVQCRRDYLRRIGEATYYENVQN